MLGIEINKIRILARHSGDTILRYVADAPLRSLRGDLGLSDIRPQAPASSHSPGEVAVSSTRSSVVNRRLRSLEASLERMGKEVQSQAQDLVGLATEFARTDMRIFVLNTVTAAVHFARSSDEGHTACGWPFARVCRTATGPAFRIISNLVDIPGTMLCERCLPTERALAMRLMHVDLSGDEAEQ